MTPHSIPLTAPELRALSEAGVCEVWRPVRFPRSGAFVLVEMQDGSLWPYQSDDGESAVCNDNCEHPMNSPFGAPGTELWVKETWAPEYPERRDYIGDIEPGPVQYLVDWAGIEDDVCWMRAVSMPRWASRTTVETTSVRVEMRDGVWGWVASLKRIQP